MNPVKLFCFPYGGGSAMTYVSWKKFFGDQIELCYEFEGGHFFINEWKASIAEIINETLIREAGIT